MRTAPALLLALAAAAGAPALAAQARAPRAPAPLFAADSTLPIVLTADWRTVFRDRSDAPKPQPGVLGWTGEAGAAETLSVTLEPRGHFRKMSKNCEVPPIRIRFPDKPDKGSLWRGARSLKLVTHCKRGSREYQQYLLSEYLTYRMYNVLTDTSYRARLVQVAYRTPQGEIADSSLGILIESDGMLGDRLRLTERQGAGTRNADVDQDLMRLVELYEFMIGNVDWSVPAQHNISVFIGEDSVATYAIPYDWDHSGFVNTRYAKPPPQLTQMRTVRDRLYRGFCGDFAPLDRAIQRAVARRAAIEALLDGETRLAPDRLKDHKKYLDEFYRIVQDPKQRKRNFEESCRRLDGR